MQQPTHGGLPRVVLSWERLVSCERLLAIPKSDEGWRLNLKRLRSDRLVSLSADGGHGWPQRRVDDVIGYRRFTANDGNNIAPLGGRAIDGRREDRSQCVANAAIRVGAGRRGLRVGSICCLNSTVMLVLVMAEMGRLHLGRMLADAGRRSPRPLERQHDHEEQQDKAAHEGRQCSNASVRGIREVARQRKRVRSVARTRSRTSCEAVEGR